MNAVEKQVIVKKTKALVFDTTELKSFERVDDGRYQTKYVRHEVKFIGRDKLVVWFEIIGGKWDKAQVCTMLNSYGVIRGASDLGKFWLMVDPDHVPGYGQSFPFDLLKGRTVTVDVRTVKKPWAGAGQKLADVPERDPRGWYNTASVLSVSDLQRETKTETITSTVTVTLTTATATATASEDIDNVEKTISVCPPAQQENAASEGTIAKQGPYPTDNGSSLATVPTSEAKEFAASPSPSPSSGLSVKAGQVLKHPPKQNPESADILGCRWYRELVKTCRKDQNAQSERNRHFYNGAIQPEVMFNPAWSNGPPESPEAWYGRKAWRDPDAIERQRIYTDHCAAEHKKMVKERDEQNARKDRERFADERYRR